MKAILLISLLLTLGLQVTVTNTDKCSQCIEFKSQSDCENNGLGCEWKTSACGVKAITPPEIIKTYCEQVQDPGTQCAKTFGCAYVDQKCTHFTGCTAYVKTSLAECQAISGQCITNGVTCDDAKLCKDYTKEVCETTPGLLSPYKCKLDGETCRELKCTEADATFTTDDQCDAWQNGCVTTGQGCIDVLPNCNALTGTAETCLKMVGKDGKCILDSTSTTGACKLRVCAEASLTTYDDTTCGDYKTGCKSTAFSCVDTLLGCSSYPGNQTSCLNYLGSDGKCAADSAATQCRARKCEDKLSAVLTECTAYLAGCKTNGVSCVTTLQNCSTYKGTTTTCAKIVGLDGNCKGTSATDANASCAVKTCTDDDTGKETTDTDCQKIQSDCKTTGSGCAKTITTACSSYTDDGNCNKYVGSDGKCKPGAGGATPKCAVRTCADNTTATTNTDCKNYQFGCVTNGAGCVAETTCVLTTLKAACASPRSTTCGWTEGCVSNSCTTFGSNQSLCENKISNTNPCIWKNNTCLDALCSDYTFTDDTVCNSKKKNCVTNGTKCADPAVCAEFTGTMTQCRAYKAKCTNTSDSVAATTPCVARTCADSDITATQDSDCDNYLTDCLYAGTNKCISKTAVCTDYLGASANDCKDFTQNDTDTTKPRIKCGWSATSSDPTKCVIRTCETASGMTDTTGCGIYLTGCVYDGNDSCVDEDAGCTSFKYKTNPDECQSLRGKTGQDKCYNGSGGFCKKKACTDAPNTSAYQNNVDCGTFLDGCLTTGAGCVAPTANCSSYQGTSVTCSNFTGNSFPCLRRLTCIKPAISCTSKTDATSNKDCQTYSNTCVLTFGTTNCQDTQANCTDYVLSGTTATEKTAYCNSVKTTAGAFCAYNPSIAGTCVARTCALWSTSLGVTCTNYAGASSCSTNTDYCYTPASCESYTIPNGTTDKAAWCQNMISSANRTCRFDQNYSNTTCKAIASCEEAIAPALQDDCYDQTGFSDCVLIPQASSPFKCVKIQTDCASYDITNVITANKSTFCPTLKSNNNGQIVKCKYSGSGNVCAPDTCENITSPTSQTNCNALPNCIYYSSKCYTIKSCTSIDVSSVSGDPARLAFCQNMKDSNGTDFCSFANGDALCSAPQLCTEYIGLTAAASAAAAGNLAACNANRDKDGTVCTYVDNATTCSKATGAEICTLIATGITADADCDLKTLPKACKKDTGASCIAKALCSAMNSSPSLAACNILTGPDGFYCSYDSSVTANCIVAPNSCSTLTGNTLATCNTFINKYGKTCSWRSGSSCADPTCEDAVSPKSQADCDLLGSGCYFYNASCVKNAAACTSYTFPTAVNTNTLRFTYCNGRVTTTGGVCTYTDSSSNCVAAAACSTYTAAGAAFSDKQTYCNTILTTDNFDCVYSTGASCKEAADSCTSYTGMTTATITADCALLFDTLGRSCVGVASAAACSYPTCESITSPGEQKDCDAIVPGCLYSEGQCVTPNLCSSYSTGGSNAIAFCGGLKGTNGAPCYANGDPDAFCTSKTCSDVAAQYFTTHRECQDYSPQCKSDGVGCVDITAACNSVYGNATACSWFLDETGQGKCGEASAAVDTQACAANTCEMNVTAQNQGDCDSFITGVGCQWKNPGCYGKTVPCNQYRGTATECATYVGNSIKCFGDSVTRAACRDRVCTDKTTAVDDADCDNFMKDCIFNGAGCVAKTASCSSFKGTNTTCKNFKAEDGDKSCWSTSSTLGNCVDRTCSHLLGLSDAECKAHYYDDEDCITDGTGCVLGPKTCSQFRGNDDTCSKLTASDGPCKASSISTTAVACTPKVCYEAPNTYTTDQQCKDYHSTCKTNGRGCQATVNCTDISNKTSCAANTSCSWTSSCRATSTTCASLTSSGQSVCVNNPTLKCAWYTGGSNSANAKCRDYTCEDYDATLITHDACQKASNNICTTTGAGCVTYSTCSTYTKSACESATTTEKSKKCKWEGITCRQQKCSDLTGATDELCDGQLTGCKSNGTSCIGPNYDCSIFNGSQKFCLIDSAGQPCLYIEGTCYSYDNCTDITTPTQTNCQKFSTNCIQGSTTCKALNQCSNYDKDSCSIGINKTTCGWLPTNACAEFKLCSDAKGTSWSDCFAWNSSCISDGTACVPYGDCGSYLKPLSCEGNYDTAYNACFWTGTTCRLKQCSDGTGVTDSECSNFIVKEGVCTTNGTACVLRAACATYLTETTCTVGSDGIPCIYSFPVGTTTGNKSCRPKECTDILGTSNDQCVGQINNRNCVSNGKTCVNQGTCASYKNKISCSAEGSDNPRCVFTAAATTADPLAGTCQAFTSCASASGDSATCLSNRSCKYTDTTKKCETTDCKTFTPTGQCQPIPSFDAKTFTICTSSANGCTAGDPTSLASTDCFSTVSRYTYTWNSSTSKCQSCKGTTSTPNNSTNGNTTTDTTTDSGYVLSVSMALAILGFLA